MKPNSLIVSLLVAVATLSTAHATVTILFNDPFFGGMSSNLANSQGVVSNGMKYGIIVDTNGNGFLSSYDTVPLTPGTSVQLTTNGGVATGDRLILANDLTSDSGQGGVLVEEDGTTLGGDGGVSGIFLPLENGVAAGNSFILVWFDGFFERSGSLGSPEFVIPPDGYVVSYAEVFVGVDPIRPTSTPEPSSVLLGLLGAFGLLRRRRR